MRKIIFNPNTTQIDYDFTDGNCYKEKSGVCPMENFANMNLIDCLQIRRTEFEFCPRMAKRMLDKTLQPTFPVQIYLHKKCGHYTFQDGRHRTCITQHLHNLGINYNLEVYLYEPNGKCNDCKNISNISKRSLIL